MARKPFRFKVTDTSVSIVFNKEGWEPINTKLCENLEKRFNGDGNIMGENPAEYIADALDLKCLSVNGRRSYTNYMGMLEIDVKHDALGEPD